MGVALLLDARARRRRCAAEHARNARSDLFEREELSKLTVASGSGSARSPPVLESLDTSRSQTEGRPGSMDASPRINGVPGAERRFRYRPREASEQRLLPALERSLGQGDCRATLLSVLEFGHLSPSHQGILPTRRADATTVAQAVEK